VRKAWKWTLAAVGIPALCFAALGVDSYHRANSAIADHDQRLAKDIAAYRAAIKPKRVVDPIPSAQALKRLPCPRSLVGKPPPDVLNLGHSGIRSMSSNVYGELRDAEVERSMFTPREKRLSGDEVITALALTHRTLSEGGYALSTCVYSYEDDAMDRLRDIVDLPEGPKRKADELRRLGSALDDLVPRRLPLQQIQWGEHLMDRAEVLNVLHKKADPLCFIRRGPGWKEFFSWRILIAKCLNQLEDRHRRLRELDPLPPAEWKAALQEIHHETDLTESRLIGGAVGARRRELKALLDYTVVRTGVAIVLFKIERRREPRLEDLVPDYLPRLPRNPFDDVPFEYENQRLRVPPSSDSGEILWGAIQKDSRSSAPGPKNY
jgi:hypothetical protein